MSRTLLLGALSLATFGATFGATLGAASGVKSVQAQPAAKAKPACGLVDLPLVVGNQWTYQVVAASTTVPDDRKRIIPTQPDKITITVKAVAPEGGKTVVTLEEQVDARTYETKLVCGGGKLQIDPNSVLFAGEPGGALGFSFTTFARKDDATSWQLSGGRVSGGPWREDVIATWKRTPSDKTTAKGESGKLELERQFTVNGAEPVGAIYANVTATKFSVETTGRVTIDGTDKVHELPAGWINSLWITKDLGVVQFFNSYGHQYSLATVKLVK